MIEVEKKYEKKIDRGLTFMSVFLKFNSFEPQIIFKKSVDTCAV